MAESEIVMDRGCFERGCACYDDRVDKDGVVVKLSKSDNLANLGIDSKDQKVMPTDYVVDMAREAGFEFIEQFPEDFQKLFERFAALIAAHEREACAKVCEEEHDKSKFGVNGMHCAAAIRARGEK